MTTWKVVVKSRDCPYGELLNMGEGNGIFCLETRELCEEENCPKKDEEKVEERKLDRILALGVNCVVCGITANFKIQPWHGRDGMVTKMENLPISLVIREEDR